jgi:hypothetical protein
MSSRSEPRFRIRLDDGSEVAIPTVEALARRIDRGEVLPNTELHDIGTGAWSAARESAVVRFILEERESDGKAPLEAWKGELGSGPGPAPGPPSTPAPPEQAPPRPPPLRSRRGGPAEDLPYLDFSDEEEEPAADEPEEPAGKPSGEGPPAKEPSAEAPAAEDPAARTVPYCLSGGTDAKAFSTLGIRCFGFAPLRLPPELDFAGMFHGVDERVPTEGLRFGARVLDRFLDLA